MISRNISSSITDVKENAVKEDKSLDHWEPCQRTEYYPEILYFRINAVIDFGFSPFGKELRHISSGHKSFLNVL